MATVRTNWHQPVVELDDADPFALPVERAGVPIDLSGELAELGRSIVELVHEIHRLDVAGVSCPILHMADTSCHACPISEHTGATPKGELCRLGRALETACTKLAVIEDGS